MAHGHTLEKILCIGILQQACVELFYNGPHGCHPTQSLKESVAFLNLHFTPHQ
jgi:hypothetical protein